MRTPQQAHRDLAMLANFLDDLPHSKFHMPEWVSKDATAESCGTAGCAGGWAATVFGKAGWSISGRNIWYLSFKGSQAFAHFFGIPASLSVWITCGYGVKESNITPHMVANRIRKVLKTVDPQALVEVGDRVPEPLPC